MSESSNRKKSPGNRGTGFVAAIWSIVWSNAERRPMPGATVKQPAISSIRRSSGIRGLDDSTDWDEALPMST